MPTHSDGSQVMNIFSKKWRSLNMTVLLLVSCFQPRIHIVFEPDFSITWDMYVRFVRMLLRRVLWGREKNWIQDRLWRDAFPFLGVKLGLRHWGRYIDRGCWGEYLDQREMKWQEVGENFTLSVITCTLLQVYSEWPSQGDWDSKECRMNGEKRTACRILVGKPEGKRQLGRQRRKWVDNNVGKFLSSCATDRFSRRAQLHEVTYFKRTQMPVRVDNNFPYMKL
jgi:hypothetical protein